MSRRVLNRYILSEVGRSVAIVFGLISSVVLLVNFIEILRNLDAAPDATYADALWLSLLKAPMLLVSVLPFVFLFGTLVAYVRLNRRSELVAMRATGMSAWSFVGPAALLAMVVGLSATTVLSPLASIANQTFETMRQGILDKAAGVVANDDIWLRQSHDNKQFVIHAKRGADAGPITGVVDVFVFSTMKDGSLKFDRRIKAKTGEIRPGFWQLKGVVEHAPDVPPIEFNALALPSPFTERDLKKAMTKPSGLTFWELQAASQQLRKAGFSTAAYDLKWHQGLAAPILFAAMTTLAAAFALRLARLGGLVGLASLGVAAGFGFYFLNDVFAAFASSGLMPAPAAAWIPPLTAILSGVGVLAYTEDG